MVRTKVYFLWLHLWQVFGDWTGPSGPTFRSGVLQVQSPGQQPPRHLGTYKNARSHLSPTPAEWGALWVGLSHRYFIKLSGWCQHTIESHCSDQGPQASSKKGQIVDSFGFAGCDLCCDPSIRSRRHKSSKNQNIDRGSRVPISLFIEIGTWSRLEFAGPCSGTMRVNGRLDIGQGQRPCKEKHMCNRVRLPWFWVSVYVLAVLL